MSQGPPPPSRDQPSYKSGELIIVCGCGDLRQDRYAIIPSGRTYLVSISFFGLHALGDSVGTGCALLISPRI